MVFLSAVLLPIVLGTAAALLHVSYAGKKILYTAVLILTDLLALLSLAYPPSLSFFRLTEDVIFGFSLDATGKWFLLGVVLLYSAALFYAFSYMEHDPHPDIFFAFYFVSYGAMLSICAASNLVTLYFCFEIATLTSVPLVLQERTKEAIAAALKYLFYSIGGALLGLWGVFYVYLYSVPDKDFRLSGILDPAKYAGHENLLLAVIFIAIIGFGTKAGLYPMHGWLPTAHPIAPAPASALLSGIIAKAGVLAVIRLVYFSVGAQFLRGTWVQTAWMCLCMLTIFMGSMMAFREKITKKRLAYSTISQISYLLLGLSFLSPEGFSAGMLQFMAHASAKGCLFLCAGIFMHNAGKTRVDELRGLGRRMPFVFWCFLFAALSLVGIPPMGGFSAKWYLALASLGNGYGVLSVLPVVILLISALLTAGYTFPIVIDGFFPGKDFAGESDEKIRVPYAMLIPLAVFCTVSLLVGLYGSRIAAFFMNTLTR